MAVQLFYWLLLWKLCFCLKDVRCFCNVACTTNYSKHLECACSGISPLSSFELEVQCWNDDGTKANGTCLVHPPGSGCQMYLKDLAVSLDTNCTAWVRDQHGSPMDRGAEPAFWILGDIVKTMPPFNVCATRGAGGVNISWDVKIYNHISTCLRYRVRLRDPTEVRTFEETSQYLFVDSSRLLPNTRYQADIQATMCMESYYQGPWSSWSPAVDIMEVTVGGMWAVVLYVSIAALFSCLSVGLCYLSRPFCLKKRQLIHFIPDPSLFFQPLHQKYGGNFKDWVHPVFSEAEVLMVAATHVPLSNQKLFLRSHHGNQMMECHVQEEKEEEEEGEEGDYDHQEAEEGKPLHIVRDSFHPSFSGPLSLDMVVLSGAHKDETPPELHGDGDAGGGGGAGSGEAAGGGIGGGEAGTSERFPRLALRRVWLGGRMCGWTEPWDDDYPRVDLDTVDSGFGESDCSSPVCSDLPSEEEPQGSAPFFGQDGGVKSNYVRQWMKTHQHPAPPPPSPTTHPEGQ